MNYPSPKITVLAVSLILSGCSFVEGVPLDETLASDPSISEQQTKQLSNSETANASDPGASDPADPGLIESIVDSNDQVLASVDPVDQTVQTPQDTTTPVQEPVPVQETVVTTEPTTPVQQVNIQPVANPDSVFTTEDVGITINTLLDNDTDQEGDALSILSYDLTSANGGQISTYSDGVLQYIPQANFHGVDTFNYTISDGRGGEASAVVSVTVASVNDIPVASPDSGILDQSTSLVLNVIENDTGLGDGASVSIGIAPSHGSVVVGADGKVTYTPTGDYFGPDSFTYALTDIDGDSSIATVDLSINCLANCTRDFQLSWDASASANVISYKVYIGEDPNTLNQVFDVGNVLAYQHTVSTKGTYYFAVAAVNDQAVESVKSTVESAVF